MTITCLNQIYDNIIVLNNIFMCKSVHSINSQKIHILNCLNYSRAKLHPKVDEGDVSISIFWGGQ